MKLKLDLKRGEVYSELLREAICFYIKIFTIEV
jgi:hypothetical protein